MNMFVITKLVPMVIFLTIEQSNKVNIIFTNKILQAGGGGEEKEPPIVMKVYIQTKKATTNILVPHTQPRKITRYTNILKLVGGGEKRKKSQSL